MFIVKVPHQLGPDNSIPNSNVISIGAAGRYSYMDTTSKWPTAGHQPLVNHGMKSLWAQLNFDINLSQ